MLPFCRWAFFCSLRLCTHETYIYIYLYMYVYICTYIYIYISVYVCICIYIYICTYIYIHVPVHVQHTCMYVSIYLYVHKQAYEEQQRKETSLVQHQTRYFCMPQLVFQDKRCFEKTTPHQACFRSCTNPRMIQ